MTKEEMLEVGEKIKNQTASQEEVLAFITKFSEMIKDIKEDLA